MLVSSFSSVGAISEPLARTEAVQAYPFLSVLVKVVVNVTASQEEIR